MSCRISIYDERDRTILAIMSPSKVLAMFKTHRLKAVALEVEENIVIIIKEAAPI
jgi:uncharacterized protein (DUF302 family)